MNSGAIGDGKIGVTTFITRPVPHNKCGSDGLPVTPNSIKVLGRAQCFKSIRHTNLCRYLDFCRGKHDRIFCVSEFHENNVLSLISKQRSSILSEWHQVVTKTIYEILNGLAYLASRGIVHHNLDPSNILIDSKGCVKLFAYGLYYMTNCGQDVSFPVGSVCYTSPEECLSLLSHDRLHFPSSKLDVWSVGVICLELCLGARIFHGRTPKEALQNLLSFLMDEKDVVMKMIELAGVKNATEVYSKLPDPMKIFLQKCLTVHHSSRPTAEELLHVEMFAELNQLKIQNEEVYSGLLLTENFTLPEIKSYVPSKVKEPLLERDYEEIWHLWKLAGGDLFTEVRRSNTVHSTPPILNLPLSMTLFGEVSSLSSTSSHLYDSKTIILPLENLIKRLKEVKPESYYPLLECQKEDKESEEVGSDIKLQNDTSTLPLVIKENDIEYQLHRLILYKRLLMGYPHFRNRIWKEARVDIPPYLRGMVWTALLDVQGDVKTDYERIDKETPLSSDRQIAVDIPRCHQYDALLSSPTAHLKFKRVLKAWLKSHPHLTYWQGLDSLCAAFLHLNFNTEHLAWAAMSKFVDKYLFEFFLKDNSAIIQEYLAVFRHLIAFHDPELSNHLDSIGFAPELYSIPWFLTMFTHVFPLHKIAHLWDTLLLGNSSFPLCVGVAILKQLRAQLLDFDFNECILMFSDLPEIDIDAVVQASIQIFCSSPKSSTYRVHAKHKDTATRQTVSYYSGDYNTLPHSELSMSEVPLEELKSETSPRISADDMIQLCELRGQSDSRTPVKKSGKNAKPKLCILDVRSTDEFQRAAIPGSYNIPITTGLHPDGTLVSSTAVMQTVNQLKPRLVVVVGNKHGRDDVKFSAALVKEGYRGVVVLHQGVDVLRTTGLLTIQ